MTEFQKWEANAEHKRAYEFGYLSRHQRHIYDMLDQEIFIETFFHWNKKPYTQTLCPNFNIKKDNHIMKIAEKHHGIWEQGWYSEDGYGFPLFTGKNDTENCFSFLREYNEWKKSKKTS